MVPASLVRTVYHSHLGCGNHNTAFLISIGQEHNEQRYERNERIRAVFGKWAFPAVMDGRAVARNTGIHLMISYSLIWQSMDLESWKDWKLATSLKWSLFRAARREKILGFRRHDLNCWPSDSSLYRCIADHNFSFFFRKNRDFWRVTGLWISACLPPAADRLCYAILRIKCGWPKLMI